MLWVLEQVLLIQVISRPGGGSLSCLRMIPLSHGVLCPAESAAVQSSSCCYLTVPHTQGPPVLRSLVLSSFRVDDTSLAVAKVGASAHCWGPRGKAFSPGLWEGPVGMGGRPTCGLILTRCQWGSDCPSCYRNLGT